MTTLKKKTIRKRLDKKCSICNRKIRVISYADRSYRGGHYFGKVPLVSKKEIKKAMGFGTKVVVMDGYEMNVMKKDPKPYGHFEYWECPKCYWGGK